MSRRPDGAPHRPFSSTRSPSGKGREVHQWKGEAGHDPIEAAALKRDDRKRQRKEARKAQREQHIAAQAQWSAHRRALREAREKAKQEKATHHPIRLLTKGKERVEASSSRSSSSSRTSKAPTPKDSFSLDVMEPRTKKQKWEEEEERSKKMWKRKGGEGEERVSTLTSTGEDMKHRRTSSPSSLGLSSHQKEEKQSDEDAARSPTLKKKKKEEHMRSKQLEAPKKKKKENLLSPPPQDDDSPDSTSSASSRPANKATSSSVLPPLFRQYNAAAHRQAPPELLRFLHRCFNQLAIPNVVDITKEIIEVFQNGGITARRRREKQAETTKRGGKRTNPSEAEEENEHHTVPSPLEDPSNAHTTSASLSTSTKNKKHQKRGGETVDPTTEVIRHGKRGEEQETEIAMVFLPVSREVALSCVLEEIYYRASSDSTSMGGVGGAGFSTVTAGLPFAALVRGLQLLGGDMVSGTMLEYLSRVLYQSVQEGEESAASALTMLLALLYRLFGVDVVLISSLLRMLLEEGEEEVNACTTRSSNESKKEDPLSSNAPAAFTAVSPSTSPGLSPRVLCGASCALTLLRTCGEKLLNEVPAEVDALLQKANHLSEELSRIPSSTSTSNAFLPSSSSAPSASRMAGSARFVSLVRVMRDIIRGGRSRSRSGLHYGPSDGKDPDAEMITRGRQELKRLLPSYPSSSRREEKGGDKGTLSSEWLNKEGKTGGWVLGSTSRVGAGKGDDTTVNARGGGGGKEAPSLSRHQDRLLSRMIQTAHRVEGIPFRFLLSSEKPPRWWIPGTIPREELVAGGSEKTEQKATPSIQSFEEEEEAQEDEEEEEEDTALDSHEDSQHIEKMKQIKAMRADEKALSSQRFHTENTREIFRCLTSATDDMDAFAMLLRRDPMYQNFPDVCKVVLQCCAQEKVYNPFYGDVLERFCHTRRACRTVVQFTLWDYFKSVRLYTRPDVCGFLNIACTIAAWMENEVLDLSALRGLDLDETNKMIGLLARLILLRIILFLSPKRLMTLFFGGDGHVALDFKTDTTPLRNALDKMLELYFVESTFTTRDSTFALEGKQGKSSSAVNPSSPSKTKWLREMFDVVAVGTCCDIYARPSTSVAMEGKSSPPFVEEAFGIFQKRVKLVRKALNQGIL